MRYLALAMLAMLFAGTASSQNRFGAKAGIVLNYLNTRGEGEGNFSNLKTGFTLGVSYEMMASKNFAIQPELNYIHLSADQSLNSTEFKLDYFQIPVLLKGVTNGQKFSVYAGPQLSFLTNASMETGGQKSDIQKNVTETNFDAVAGFEYITPVNITINVRYTHGLTNVFKTEFEGLKSRHQYGTIALGYVFGKKRP